MIKKNIQWSLKQIIIMIRKNKILFNNVFQRSYVWERSRQSRLIHSFLEDYPVPALYAVCEEDIDSDLMASFVENLFSGDTIVSGEYMDACKNGSAKSANIRRRHDEIEKRWEEFFAE